MAERLLDELTPLGDVTTKKMFGGYGVFEDAVMFALVDSSGGAFLRADETTAARFEEAGSEAHGRMPYWRIPHAVLDDLGNNGARRSEGGQAEVAARETDLVATEFESCCVGSTRDVRRFTSGRPRRRAPTATPTRA
jgi:DNA transformation protein